MPSVCLLDVSYAASQTQHDATFSLKPGTHVVIERGGVALQSSAAARLARNWSHIDIEWIFGPLYIFASAR